jgi:tetratricopeptide (TPR) repeat protein
MREQLGRIVIVFAGAAAALAGQSSLERESAAEHLNNLGAEAYLAGDYPEAESLYTSAITEWQAVPGEAPTGFWRTMNNLAALRRAQGRYAEAESLYVRILDHFERRDNLELATALNNFAELYRTQGQADKATALAERSVKLARRLLPPADARITRYLQTLAAVYRALDRTDDAAALLEECRSLHERSGEEQAQLATTLNNLAEIASARGRLQEAEALARRALELWEQAYGPAHQRVAVALNNLAQALRRQKRFVEAAPLYERAVAILETTTPGLAALDLARCLGNLAEMQHELDKLPAAVATYRRAIKLLEEAVGPAHTELALMINRLAEVRRAQRRYVESAQLYRRSIAILQRSVGDADPRAQQSSVAYRRLLAEASRVLVGIE